MGDHPITDPAVIALGIALLAFGVFMLWVFGQEDNDE